MNVRISKPNGDKVQITINGEMELPESMRVKFPLKRRFFVTLLEGINEELIKGGTFSLNTIESKSDLAISGI